MNQGWPASREMNRCPTVPVAPKMPTLMAWVGSSGFSGEGTDILGAEKWGEDDFGLGMVAQYKSAVNIVTSPDSDLPSNSDDAGDDGSKRTRQRAAATALLPTLHPFQPVEDLFHKIPDLVLRRCCRWNSRVGELQRVRRVFLRYPAFLRVAVVTVQGFTQEIRSGGLDGVGEPGAGESVLVLARVDTILWFVILLSLLVFANH